MSCPWQRAWRRRAPVVLPTRGALQLPAPAGVPVLVEEERPFLCRLTVCLLWLRPWPAAAAQGPADCVRSNHLQMQGRSRQKRGAKRGPAGPVVPQLRPHRAHREQLDHPAQWRRRYCRPVRLEPPTLPAAAACASPPASFCVAHPREPSASSCLERCAPSYPAQSRAVVWKGQRDSSRRHLRRPSLSRPSRGAQATPRRTRPCTSVAARTPRGRPETRDHFRWCPRACL